MKNNQQETIKANKDDTKNSLQLDNKNIANSTTNNESSKDNSAFNTIKINEDNTRFGDWVIGGRAIDF